MGFPAPWNLRSRLWASSHCPPGPGLEVCWCGGSQEAQAILPCPSSTLCTVRPSASSLGAENGEAWPLWCWVLMNWVNPFLFSSELQRSQQLCVSLPGEQPSARSSSARCLWDVGLPSVGPVKRSRRGAAAWPFRFDWS